MLYCNCFVTQYWNNRKMCIIPLVHANQIRIACATALFPLVVYYFPRVLPLSLPLSFSLSPLFRSQPSLCWDYTPEYSLSNKSTVQLTQQSGSNSPLLFSPVSCAFSIRCHLEHSPLATQTGFGTGAGWHTWVPWGTGPMPVCGGGHMGFGQLERRGGGARGLAWVRAGCHAGHGMGDRGAADAGHRGDRVHLTQAAAPAWSHQLLWG